MNSLNDSPLLFSPSSQFDSPQKISSQQQKMNNHHSHSHQSSQSHRTREQIRALVIEIEKKYKETVRETAEWDLESEEREAQIEKLRSQISTQKEQRFLLESLTKDLIQQNECLSNELDSAELESQSLMDALQLAERKNMQMQCARTELTKEQDFHQSSMISACALEQKNEAAKKQLQKSMITVSKLETEVEFSKERLQATIKKFNSIESNEKSVRQVRDSLLMQKAAYDQQIAALSFQNSSLNQSIQDLQTSFVLMKQKSTNQSLGQLGQSAAAAFGGGIQSSSSQLLNSIPHLQQQQHQNHSIPHLKSISLTIPHQSSKNSIKNIHGNSMNNSSQVYAEYNRSFLSDEQVDEEDENESIPSKGNSKINNNSQTVTQRQRAITSLMFDKQAIPKDEHDPFKQIIFENDPKMQQQQQKQKQHVSKQQSTYATGRNNTESPAQTPTPSQIKRQRTKGSFSLGSALLGASIAVAAGVIIHRMRKK